MPSIGGDRPELSVGIVGAAMRQSLGEGYGVAQLRRDLLAGLVVGIVALPLSMALAIAVGVPPQYGLYTAIVGGAVAALAGGSRVNVTGPTAAFVVLLAPVARDHGLAGLMIATLLAGLLLLGLALARMGRLITFVPDPVVAGFTAGIAVVIASLQVADVLGLTLPHAPESFLERVVLLARALPGVHWPDLAIAAVTLVLLVGWPRVDRRIPAPVVALTLATAVAFALARFAPALAVETVAGRFGGIPAGLPTPHLPWHFGGRGGEPFVLSLEVVRDLMPAAVAIAVLGAIESLLCAVAADAMTGRRHDPDAELVGQGLANLLVPFFGGFAATGAIARTATSIRAGAVSPVASLTHAAFVLIAMLALAPILGWMPMAGLAALLCFVAWNMADLGHLRRVVRISPRSDVLVLACCFSLTVLFDMVVAVTAGVALAALLFMRRMAEVSGARLVSEEEHVARRLPDGVALYEIDGPLFFGAARKAFAALERVDVQTRGLVLDLETVTAIDATGLVNLESAVHHMTHRGVKVAIAGLQPQPRRALERAGWMADGRVHFADDVEAALQLVR